MSKRQTLKYLILRSIGNFLFLFAIFGVIATFGPALYYEVQFRIIEIRGVHFNVAQTFATQGNEAKNPSFADLMTGAKEQTIVPPDSQFSIVIPKIGAAAKIYPNVDPTNESKFLPVLLKGVAHAAGSVFPGLSGNVYLFAHSSDNFWDAGRYNAVFYLLKDLNVGDEIVIFYQGNRYNYFVTGSKIVDPSDVSLITHAKEGNEQLILQTCWPPGTAWKRLMVFARPRKTDVIFKK